MSKTHYFVNVLATLCFLMLVFNCPTSPTPPTSLTISSIETETTGVKSFFNDKEIKNEILNFIKKSKFIEYNEQRSMNKFKVLIEYKKGEVSVLLDIKEKGMPSSIVIEKSCNEKKGEEKQFIKFCLTKGLEELNELIKIKIASNEELINILNSSEKLTLKFAVREVGERKLKQSSQTLIKLLKKTDDKDILLSIIGSIGLIKDENAVEELVKMVDSDDFEIANASIYALGDIGGEKVQRYLSLIAIQNKREYIQKIAQEILENLKD